MARTIERPVGVAGVGFARRACQDGAHIAPGEPGIGFEQQRNGARGLGRGCRSAIHAARVVRLAGDILVDVAVVLAGSAADVGGGCGETVAVFPAKGADEQVGAGL